MKNLLKILLAVFAVIVLAIVGLGVLAYYTYLHTTPLSQAEIDQLEVDWSEITGGNWSPWVTAADGSQEWNPAKSLDS